MLLTSAAAENKTRQNVTDAELEIIDKVLIRFKRIILSFSFG
jgi:predicted phosphoadenosine phosphosulfate sulfurtransferase